MSGNPTATSAEANESVLQTRILGKKYLHLTSTPAHLAPTPGIGGFSRNLRLYHVQPNYISSRYKFDVRVPKTVHPFTVNGAIIPEIPTAPALKRTANLAAKYHDKTLGYQTIGQPAAGGVRYVGEELIPAKKARIAEENDQTGAGEQQPPTRVTLHPLDLDTSRGEENIESESSTDGEEDIEEESNSEGNPEPTFCEPEVVGEPKDKEIVPQQPQDCREEVVTPTPRAPIAAPDPPGKKRANDTWLNHNFTILG